jgi:hypothetical protein
MAIRLSNEHHKAINWMDRTQIVALLENFGFACYDRETTDELRDAVRENVADGTIPASYLND